MTMRHRRRTFFAAFAAAGLTFGFLAGMATDRIQHDRQRAMVLARYEHAVQRLHERLMALEAVEARRP
jgi:hypothetical protein